MSLEAYPESGVQVEEFSICIRTSETISRYPWGRLRGAVYDTVNQRRRA